MRTVANMQNPKPLIVGIGGAVVGASTEKALQLALRAANSEGAEIKMFGGATLAELPHYLSPTSKTSPAGQELVNAVRMANGLIIASPGYHGSVSGLVKNAIDYLEETAKDDRAYLDGVPVGLISTAFGAQSASYTLATLRSIVHTLHGWPTSIGAALNTSASIFQGTECTDAQASAELSTIGCQVFEFAHMQMNNPLLFRTGLKHKS